MRLFIPVDIRMLGKFMKVQVVLQNRISES